MDSVFTIKINKNTYKVDVGDISKSPVIVEVDGQRFEVEFEERNGQQVQSAISEKARPEPKAQSTHHQTAATENAKSVVAPMPGKILKVTVAPGDSVSKDDVVCVLEAMKMEQLIKAGSDGVIESVKVQPGQNVVNGAVLVTFQK